VVQHGQHESTEVVRELRQIIPPKLLIESIVPRDPIFLKASGLGVPLGLIYAKPPAAALVFDQMAAELETRLKLKTEDVPTTDRLMD
jgi:chromosome partitioning protein